MPFAERMLWRASPAPIISVENTMEREEGGEKIVEMSKSPLTKAGSSCKIRRTLENGRLCGFGPCQIPRMKKHFPVDPAKLIIIVSKGNELTNVL